MTYIVYADVMLFRCMIINLAILYVTNKLLQYSLSILSIIFYSFIMSITSVMVEIITLKTNIYIHHIIYAAAYIFMYYLIFKCNNLHPLCHILATAFIATLIINGLFSFISNFKYTIILRSLMFMLCIYGIGRAFINQKKQQEMHKNTYKLKLQYNGFETEVYGYMDTGNCLKDYSGNPVIIIDYRLMNTFLSKEAYYYVEQYHNFGFFEYSKIKKHAPDNFYPLACKTIGAESTVIPVFKIKKLTYSESNKAYFGVSAGISRFKLSSKDNYQILLNENFKPI